MFQDAAGRPNSDSNSKRPPPAPLRPTHGLGFASLDRAVQRYFHQGLAQSTRRTYSAAMKQFHLMCTNFNISNSFPVSEQMLCRFAAYLADAHQTIKSYLSAVRSMQISMGLPDPRDHSSLAVLKRVQAGIRQAQAFSKTHNCHVRLPITATMLGTIHTALDAASDNERNLGDGIASVLWVLLSRGTVYGQGVRIHPSDAPELGRRSSQQSGQAINATGTS